MSTAMLSHLTATELGAAARSPYRKWGSAALLRLASLPTVDGTIVEPGSDPAAVGAAVDAVVSHLGTGAVMIRSDGGLERSSYPHAGFSHGREEAVEFGRRLLAMDRAVLVLEPTDRFAQSLSATVRLVVDDHVELVAELLGPGFDCSDLNRRGVLPQLSLMLRQPAERSDEVPWPSSFRIEHHMAAGQQVTRIATRRSSMAAHHHEQARARFGADLWACPDFLAPGLEGVPLRLYSAARALRRCANAAGIDLGVFCFSYAEYLDGTHLYLDVTTGDHKYATT